MKHLLVLAALVAVATATFVPAAEWDAYKTKFGKSYSGGEDTKRWFYYSVNAGRVDDHNKRFDRGQVKYRLAVNQFSDLKYVEWQPYFRKAVTNNAPGYALNIPTQSAPASFNFRDRLTLAVQDQAPPPAVNLNCNAGWAFATALSLEIYESYFAPTPTGPLSAQQLIDCAGGYNACLNQGAQSAFEYLTTYRQNLQTDASYTRYHNAVGKCVPVLGSTSYGLAEYAKIPSSTTLPQVKTLMSTTGAPLTFEIDVSSFEFMHYSSGLFTQPRLQGTSSHFMTMVGYRKGELIAQNSFGVNWGEQGLIRFDDSMLPTLLTNALMPTEAL